MKLTVANFGPLKNFCFDTSKQLHLIVGENNIGKSYGITLVYLALKSLLNADEFSTYRFRSTDNVDTRGFPPPARLLKPSEETDVTEYVRELIKRHLEVFFVSFMNESFAATFEKPELTRNINSKEEFSLTLQSDDFTVVLHMTGSGLFVESVETTKKFFARKIRTHRTTKTDDRKVTVYLKDGDSDREHAQALLSAAVKFSRDFYRSATNHVRSVHFLPASRSGLYQALNAFGQIVAELSKSRSFLSSKIELPGIPEPLSDYFLRLSEIQPVRSDEDSVFEDIASQMESQILRGKVGFDKKSKVITYTPGTSSLKLELSSASSMVSELSPIVSYIRHILPFDARFSMGHLRPSGFRRRRLQRPGASTLVFVEEPEAHLHPRVQVQLVGIFCRLVDAGVSLAVTTHSNYLFNEFSNKLVSSEIDSRGVRASQLVPGVTGSTEKVLQADEYGIEDDNFGKVSEEILNDRIEALNNKSNAPERN